MKNEQRRWKMGEFPLQEIPDSVNSSSSCSAVFNDNYLCLWSFNKELSLIPETPLLSPQ